MTILVRDANSHLAALDQVHRIAGIAFMKNLRVSWHIPERKQALAIRWRLRR